MRQNNKMTIIADNILACIRYGIIPQQILISNEVQKNLWEHRLAYIGATEK